MAQIIQTSARIPEDCRDLLQRVTSRMREDNGFPAKLEAFLLETQGAQIAYQIPPALIDELKRRTEEAMAPVRALEAETKRLAEALVPYRALAEAATGGTLEQFAEAQRNRMRDILQAAGLPLSALPPAPAGEMSADELADELNAKFRARFVNPPPSAAPAAAPAEPGKPARPRRGKQLDIEDAIKGDKPKPSGKKAPPSDEQKAERRAFGDEIRRAGTAAGLVGKDLAERLAAAAGINIVSAKNILNGSVGSSPTVRAAMREAVGLPPQS